MARWRGTAKGIAIGLGGLVCLAALPVLWIETACIERKAPRTDARAPVLEPSERREEVNTYLTYPEWSIVHAYEDLAAITRASSESDFGYFGAIRRYWTSLCSISGLASRRGTISADFKTMLHVIGLSFAAEMGIKGAYETTIGRVTAWLRGARPTAEDRFAADLADDYARFLRQTPWYEYPFAAKLAAFWRTTPWFDGNIVRGLERRIALTLEWGVKAAYAKLIGLGAAASPAPLRIRSVVAGLDASDLAADPRIMSIRALADGRTVIETDRYRTFTDIVGGLARRNRDVSEIAGNTHILVTILAKPGAATDYPGTSRMFEVPVLGRAGWRRVALDVEVPALGALIRRLQGSDVTLEHIYDY